MEGGKHIQYGLLDYVPHPPACLPAYANLGEVMDMTFGSFRFLVGRKGAHRFLTLIFSGPSAASQEPSGSSTSSNDSGDEETSPLRVTKLAESGKLADLFGGLTFGSTAENNILWSNDSDNFTNFDFSNKHFIDNEEVFTDRYDGVTYPVRNMQMSYSAPRGGNSMTQNHELEDSADSTRHQIYVITVSGRETDEDAQSEAFDSLGNPFVDPLDLTMEQEISIKDVNQESKCNFPKLHGIELQGQ
jgi:hypothetical protein